MLKMLFGFPLKYLILPIPNHLTSRLVSSSALIFWHLQMFFGCGIVTRHSIISSANRSPKQFQHLISANHQRFYVKLAHSICLKWTVLIYYVRGVSRSSIQLLPNFWAIITLPTIGGGS